LRRVKINLIPHNPAEQLDYHPSTPERVAGFKATLESLGVSAYVRTPRGRDIYAACGQLAAIESEKDEMVKGERRPDPTVLSLSVLDF